MELNKTLNPISAQERVKINQNWDYISSRFSSIKLQIGLLTGGKDLDDIVNQIQSSIDNANNATQDALAAIERIDREIDNLEDIISRSNVSLREIEEAISSLNLMLSDMKYTGEYSNSFGYRKGNYVRLNKNSYVALKNNLGITPNDDGVNWRLVALGGVDGSGSVKTVNGVEPQQDGDVILTPSDIGSASSSLLNETISNLNSTMQIVDRNSVELDNLNAAINSNTITINIFEPNKITNNVYINLQNETINDFDYAESDFMEVTPGETLYQYNPQLFGFFKKFYDANMNFLESVLPQDQTDINNPSVFQVPNNPLIRYMRTTVGGFGLGDTQAKIDAINNFRILSTRSILYFNNIINLRKLSKWSGSNISFLGDSITEGFGSSKGYVSFLQEFMNLGTVRNYGIGGSSIAEGQDPMYSRSLNLDSNSDLIFVFGGTNDFANFNTPLGEIYTKDSSGVIQVNTNVNTFYGALHVMCRNLLINYPRAKIVLATPIHREIFSGQPNEYMPNQSGFYIKDYVDAIKNISDFYSIPLCDLWKISNLNPNIPQHKSLYFSPNDGIHPNAEGHERLAEVIYPFLETV